MYLVIIKQTTSKKTLLITHDCNVILLTNFFSINASILHFLIIYLKGTCTKGVKLAAMKWSYSWLNLLLTTNWHLVVQNCSNNLKTKIFRLCSDTIKVIWIIKALTSTEVSCIFFSLFEDISRCRFSGSCWSIRNAGWAWICTIAYWYCCLLMFLIMIISPITVKMKLWIFIILQQSSQDFWV